MVEPLIYDFVDITRQQYQNTFSEVLRVFARAIRRCTPYINDYDVYENTDSMGSDIRHQDCQDEQGKNRACTIDELKEYCNAMEDCSGFNSNGWLKAAANPSGEIQGTNLYVRKSQFIGNVCEDSYTSFISRSCLVLRRFPAFY